MRRPITNSNHYEIKLTIIYRQDVSETAAREETESITLRYGGVVDKDSFAEVHLRLCQVQKVAASMVAGQSLVTWSGMQIGTLADRDILIRRMPSQNREVSLMSIHSDSAIDRRKM